MNLVKTLVAAAVLVGAGASHAAVFSDNFDTYAVDQLNWVAQGGWTVAAYTAAKHGVAGLTKALANEWASKNIHVNAIAPGYFDTEMCPAVKNDPLTPK